MPADSIRRVGSVVLLGSGLGFGIGLLLTPVISRIFTPEIFGVFSTVVAVSTALVGVSTLRLEVRAQGEGDAEYAGSLIRASLLCAVAVFAIVLIASLVALAMGAGPVWLWSGPLVLMGSVQLVGTAILVRRANYRHLAVANFVQGGGTAIVQIALGLVRPALAALALGFLLPRLVWAHVIRREGLSRPQMGRIWRDERRFAATAGSSALVNSAAGQAVLILPALMAGAAAVGPLAMAIRVLVSPLAIVSQAMAAASVGEVGRRLRDGQPVTSLVRRAVRDLFVLGGIPCAVAVVAAPTLAPLLLGEPWRATGLYVALLAPGALAQFCGAPFSQLLNVAGASRELLTWDVVRLLALTMSLGLPLFVGGGLVISVAAYSCAQVVLYAWLLILVLKALGRGEPDAVH